MGSVADYVSKSLKDLLSRFVIEKIMGAIAKNIPFLASGPFGWIAKLVVSHFVGKVVTLLVTEITQGIQIMGAKWEVNGQNAAYVRAYAKRERAISVEDKKQANIDLNNSFYKFVQY